MDTNPFLTGLPLPKPDILAPEGLDFTTGTAEILRLPEVRELVTSDFIVLPCDLVCEVGGDTLLHAWMVKAASAPGVVEDPEMDEQDSNHSAALGVWYDTKAFERVKGEETDFVAVAPPPKSGVAPRKASLTSSLAPLVAAMPTDSLKDVMEEEKGLQIRHSLIMQHPRVRMLTSYRDAHIYIFPRWVLDFVEENDQMETIGEDLVGWWAKAWWQPGLPSKLGIGEVLRPVKTQKATESPSQEVESLEDEGDEKEDALSRPIRASDASVAEDDDERVDSTAEIPPVFAYLHSSKGDNKPMIRRVDTTPLLLAVSLQLAKLPSIEEAGADATPFAHPKKLAYPEGRRSKTTVTTADTLVAENVTIEEKVSIKECVVGANCQISEGSKLFQCVLMEGVVVEKGCKLTKCVLGKRSVIGAGSVLTECEVQENLLVESQSKLSSAQAEMSFRHAESRRNSESTDANALGNSRGQGQQIHVERGPGGHRGGNGRAAARGRKHDLILDILQG